MLGQLSTGRRAVRYAALARSRNLFVREILTEGGPTIRAILDADEFLAEPDTPAKRSVLWEVLT